MQLRSYQSEALTMTRDALRRAKRVAVVLPVGAGKTLVAAEAIRLALARGKRVLFVVHRIELVRQAVDRLAALGVKAGVLTAHHTDIQPVTVASIQTMRARGAYPPADLLFLDECHHARAKTWGEVLLQYPDAYVIGLTATPFRLDGQGLGDVFSELVVGVRTADLCTEGVLVEPDVYAPPGPDLSSVRVRRGDFEEGALAAAMEKPKLVGDIVDHWQRLCAGRRTVAFACSIRHSEMIVAAFLDRGVAAMHVDGRTHRDVRTQALVHLADGTVPIISNCALFGEGTDVPALECAIIARPTASRALHIQMIGRIMRAAQGKDSAVVLDHAGNSQRLGLVTDHIEYTLAGKIHAAVPRILRCPECFVVLSAPMPECPECGYVFTDEERKKAEPPVTEAGELVKLTKPDPATFYEALVREASDTNLRLGWARHRYKEKFGKWPKHPDLERLYVCRSPEIVTPEHGAAKCGRCLRLAAEHERVYVNAAGVFCVRDDWQEAQYQAWAASERSVPWMPLEVERGIETPSPREADPPAARESA